MMKILHNPRCAKSREGLKYLQNKECEFEIIDYTKNPVTEDILKEILLKLHKKPKDIVRTQEKLFKSELKGKNFTDEEWIKILLENQNLIQRPIVISKYKAVIALPPEKMDELFK